MSEIISIVRELRARMGHVWDDVTDLIVRPIRAEYHVASLGPKVFKTSATSKLRFEREDIELENFRGLKLQCSWYRPLSSSASAASSPSASPAAAPTAGADAKYPCLIYLHGNCGCRLDVRDCLFMLDEGMSVFTFDFSGSGLSEGEFVTLGYLERQDLLCVVDYLVASKKVSTIGLWGRSMGAVTAVMYAARDPSISAIVCDSPFSSLRLLAQDLACMHAGWVPTLAVKSIVSRIRNLVLDRAGFDIKDLDTLKYARMCHSVPAFIFHGKDDDFVRYEHSQAVADHYAGNCIHHLVSGDHNSTRGNDVKDVARAFLRLYLIEKPAAAPREARISQASMESKPSPTNSTPTPPATPTPLQQGPLSQVAVTASAGAAATSPSNSAPAARPVANAATHTLPPQTISLEDVPKAAHHARVDSDADTDDNGTASTSSEPPPPLDEEF